MGCKKSRGSGRFEIPKWLGGGTGRNIPFVRVPVNLLQSKKYNDLTLSAQKLYICMALESKGHIEFMFPQSTALDYGFSAATFNRAKDDLIKNGFIILKSSGRLTREKNEYRFSVETNFIDRVREHKRKP